MSSTSTPNYLLTNIGENCATKPPTCVLILMADTHQKKLVEDTRENVHSLIFFALSTFFLLGFSFTMSRIWRKSIDEIKH